MVELEICLRAKFIVGDWDLMRSKDSKPLAEIRASNLIAAPQLVSNIPLEISSLCRLHVTDLKTSFESNDVSLSYCWQIKAKFKFHGRTLIAEWFDIPVQVLPSYVHADDPLDSFGSRQPTYKYVPPPYALLVRGTGSKEYLPPPTYNLV